MKKAKEEDRKKIFNNRMRKAVAIQLILIVVFSIKIYECRPVKPDDTEKISFFAEDVFYDRISVFASPIRKAWFISFAGERYRYECYDKYEQLQTQDRTERLKSEYLTVTYVKNSDWYGSNSIVDLRSSQTVFYSLDDYNKLLKDARTTWIVLLLVASFITQGGLVFLIDKISCNWEWHKTKHGVKSSLKISDYQRMEKQLTKHKRYKNK